MAQMAYKSIKRGRVRTELVPYPIRLRGVTVIHRLIQRRKIDGDLVLDVDYTGSKRMAVVSNGEQTRPRSVNSDQRLHSQKYILNGLG